MAREVFDSFADKAVLVIGAGKMGETTLQHLKGLRPGTILVTNRSAERAEAVAARWGGRAVPFDRLGQALIEADLVISTTAASEPIVALEQYQRVQRHRRNRLALILDIAIPRDFDPRIGDLDQVMLYHVDDLRAQAEQNLRRRQKGIDPALAIIERETAACYALLRHQHDAGHLLQELGDSYDAVASARAHQAVRRAAAPERGRPRGDLAHDDAPPEPVPAPPARRRCARPPPSRTTATPTRSSTPSATSSAWATGAEFAQEDLRVCMSGPAWTSLESRLQAAPGHPDRLKPGLRRKTGMIR